MATPISACPDQVPATTAGRSPAARMLLRRLMIAVGAAAALGALAPMTGAHADGKRDPGAPIIRQADRGAPMSGIGEVRESTQLSSGSSPYVAVQGGNTSAGAPIIVKDGNMSKMPVIHGENGVICSKSQNVRSAMIPCFG